MTDEQIIAAERPRFEAWCRAVGASTDPWLPSRPVAGYANTRVQDYWTGWLECARARNAGVKTPDGEQR